MVAPAPPPIHVLQTGDEVVDIVRFAAVAVDGCTKPGERQGLVCWGFSGFSWNGDEVPEAQWIKRCSLEVEASVRVPAVVQGSKELLRDYLDRFFANIRFVGRGKLDELTI